MKIYFIRHGKDDEEFRGGWSQKSLIEEGINQSKKLTEYLFERKEEYNFNKIISSDLNRAFETASYIAEKFEMKVLLNEEWREINNGILSGMPNVEANINFPGLYFNSLSLNENYSGGESPLDFYSRIEDSFYKLVKTEKEDNVNILVVTHSGVINVIYHLVNKIEWSNKNKFYKCDYTSIHILDINNETLKINTCNLTEHLMNK